MARELIGVVGLSADCEDEAGEALERLGFDAVRVRYGTFSLVVDRFGRPSTKRGDFGLSGVGLLGPTADLPENN